MKSFSHFKGSIFLLNQTSLKKTLFKYETSAQKFEFHQSMMSSFRGVELSSEEKQKLSHQHRKNLYYYLNINLFELTRDAVRLVDIINNAKDDQLYIEASDYGAFVCMAAVYTGKIVEDKKINFIFTNSPVSLFPKNLHRKNPHKNSHFHYQTSTNSWVNNFQSLYQQTELQFKYSQVA